VSTDDSADELHLDHLLALPWLDIEMIRACGLTAAVDAVEGAGGLILPAMLERLGVKCVPLYCGCTGMFPHPPEPTPAHLKELGEVVAADGVDIGFAVDPDVDRLVLVDHDGTLLSEELTLAVCIDYLLSKEPGDVAVNLSTTGLIDEVASRHGSRVYRTPVGEANVVATMLAENIVIGGEGNGGVIYPALHPGRDALVGIAMVLQMLAEQKTTLKDIVAGYPPVAMVKDKFSQDTPFEADKVRELLSGLGEGDIDDRDGVRWSGEAGWVHVRPSNTEPIIRVIAEAPSEAEARSLVKETRRQLQS
jgi:phosphomannomutase